VPVHPALHSRASDEWWTPPEVFDPLNEEFHFTLDVCAGSRFASRVGGGWFLGGPDQDGLAVDWSSQRNVTGKPVVAWCNPPYSTVARWIEKACEQREMGCGGVTTVMLINNITETKAWHRYVMPYAAEVRFIEGRVHFIAGCDMAGLKKGERGPAPKGSVIVVFRPGHVGPPVFSTFHQRARAK
jgi:site-specific DNA-methyltransferase (adenine-specific)